MPERPTPPEPFAARLKERYGAGVDPEVSLGDAPAPPGPESGRTASELVRRLADHGLKESRYKLEGEVARGGMGAILRVWDEDLRRHLAMKVILGRGEASGGGGTPKVEPNQLSRFLEEAQVTGQLDHPGIVPVHELGLDQDGRVYFTMKLVKGRDLKAVFDFVFEEKDGWNETRALSVILRACEAVAYAHAKGVIHRDLKPANVMVGNFGEVYVMDWGLARVLGQADRHDVRLAPEFTTGLTSVKTERRDERESGGPRDDVSDSPIVTMDGDVVGTPCYMPPEQARGEVSKLSPRSDVYAVGAMLHHLLARRAPYVPAGARVSNRTVLQWVLEGPPKPLAELRPDAPAELVAICEKAMAREAERRYADTLALAEDLRAFLEHRVVRAYESGTWAETKKWVQRNKPLAASLAAAVLLLAAGLSASLVFKARADENAATATKRANDLGEANKTIEARNTELAAATKAAQENEGRAIANEARAVAGEALATQRTNDVLSLSAIQDLKDLEDRADALWPADPERVPAYEAWLADARLLIEGQPGDPAKGLKPRPSLAEHEAKLVEIRARAKPLSSEQAEADRRASPSFAEWETARARLQWMRRMLGEEPWPSEADVDEVALWKPEGGRSKQSEESSKLGARVAKLGREVDERRTYEFEDGEDRWWHAQLSKLVADLKAFTAEESGGLYSSGISAEHGWGIVRRAGFARTIGELTVEGPEAKTRWEEATAAIEASPKYGGLRMTPQIGLLPIGADPESGLWEFAHLASGEPAERGSDGKLVLKESMGLVFVLIPGGTFLMGAQSTDPTEQNYDPQAILDESPVHEVALTAYFLSKYEMTQGQWERFTGRNPSNLGPNQNFAGHQPDLLHPVELVTWTQCMEVMSRLDLSLPSEAQWENGCRGGTDTAWWTGADREGLVVHAAVGSFPANPFGLHEVHGNVWEWCLDGYDVSFYGRSPKVDPVGPTAGAPSRVLRGGGFADAAWDGRSASRRQGTPGSQDYDFGLRPARASRVPTSPPHPAGR